MRLLFPCRVAAAALVLTASACSSTFGSLPAPISGMRSASVERAADNASTRPGYATLRLRIWVPGRTHDSVPHRALPAYVSSATRKVAVTVQGANQSAPTTQKFRCTAVCAGKIVAPLGVDLITLQLEDKKNRVLSRGSATVLVFKNSGNVFDFTLDGVPASVALVPESNVLPVVPASTGYVNFDARDADGRIITPDGHYVDGNGNPLVFTIKSSNAAYRLAVKTVSAPGAPISFSYNGTQHVGKVTLTAKAARGIHTTVNFHPATLTLVPAIVTRIAPPLPIQLTNATQVPVPGGSTACSGSTCFDANSLFFFGNDGGVSQTLAFNVATGAYGAAYGQNTGGPFAGPPLDRGPTGGFYAFINDGNATYSAVNDFGFAIAYGYNFANPCGSAFLVPIGYNSSGTLYCQYGGLNQVYDKTHSAAVANGTAREIRTIGGVDYFVTVSEQSASPPGQQVYVSGSTTPVAGAIGLGTDVADGTIAYYADSDGTVKHGTTAVATFSHAVENVIAAGGSFYVYENGGTFGVSRSSGVFESARLPIGAVVQVVTGVGGAPMLVESDGMLDVMGI